MEFRRIGRKSLVKVKVYVEGGGRAKELYRRCREAFSQFFRKSHLAGRMPKIIACGSRNDAFDKFRIAFGNKQADEFVVLLVDSEGPVEPGVGSLQHLAGCDHWDWPGGVGNEHVHMMVQCMEAWFLADRDSLALYFGSDFNRSALPGRQNIEQIAKGDVLEALRESTRRCRKGRYDKGRHSFEILKQIDPERVFDASPYARSLIKTVREAAR